MDKSKVYIIPVKKLPQGLTKCYQSALNLWQTGKYAREKGGLHIAVGLWLLALEEIGKYALLQEAVAKEDNTGMFEIHEYIFKSHRTKIEKGLMLFKKWGIDLESVGIPLTVKTRTDLWYVAWNDAEQKFGWEFAALNPHPISKTENLEELFRLGLNKMHDLERSLGP